MPPIDLEALARVRTIDITTTGRQSGNPARIEIWWFRFDDRFIITGSPGRRDWYANVLADPAMVVHVHGVDHPARAVPVSDESFRRRFFEADQAAWYRDRAEIDRLVAESPMIEVTLAGP